MKKSLFILAAVAPLCLAGCNMNVGLGSYSFHYVHAQMYGGEPVHMKIASWKDDDGGIELRTEKHGTILLGDGTYALYDQEDCPLCGEVEYR